MICSGQSSSSLSVDFVRILQEQALVFVSLGMNPTEFKLFQPLQRLALTSRAGRLVYFGLISFLPISTCRKVRFQAVACET